MENVDMHTPEGSPDKVQHRKTSTGYRSEDEVISTDGVLESPVASTPSLEVRVTCLCLRILEFMPAISGK